MEITEISADTNRLFKVATALAVFTIVYNLLEGAVSVFFGFDDESLALFGFGVDSFIEVISGIGIAHMIYRIQSNPNTQRDDFERTALRITGTAFYLLTLGLLITSVYTIYIGHEPTTTLWGVIISIISIAVMWALVISKRQVGTRLNSKAIIADANCTKVCIYMSLILLASSAAYELFAISYVDSIGTLGLAYYSFKEGKECFENTKKEDGCCSCC